MDIEKLKYEAVNKALHIADVSGSALFNADCMDISVVQFRSIGANGYGLAKGKIESTNVQPLHNANRKYKSLMIALMFAFCQTDVVRCFFCLTYK